MNISIITVFKSLYDGFLGTSLIKRAVERGQLTFNIVEFASLCEPGKRLDEPTVGPGPGMIITPGVVERTIAQCEEKYGPGYKIFFSPQGTKLDQPLLHQLVETLALRDAACQPSGQVDLQNPHLILVCARYEGIDRRVEETYADLMLSIGDYVLMGGDLPAQVFLEGLLRLVPGIVGNEASLKTESFESPWLDHPEYGLPVTWNGRTVPEVLRSGNHGAINTWRTYEAAKATLFKRFDWFRASRPSQKARELAQTIIPPHYAVLMHSEVFVAPDTEGVSSVTSIDLHDIARSAATYGIKQFFVVTPLLDHQAIIKEFVAHWLTGPSKHSNPSRFESVSKLVLCSTLDEAIEHIAAGEEGKAPLTIATSAKQIAHPNPICYQDQGAVWRQGRPVLLILGTGRGLVPRLLDRCDFVLSPLEGLPNYNHLSVRSAAGIIFDRWLGLNPRTDPLVPERGVQDGSDLPKAG